MSCDDILKLTDSILSNGGNLFNTDNSHNMIVAHEMDLRNQCMESLSQYAMLIDGHGIKKYLVNGTWTHLEMTHE